MTAKPDQDALVRLENFLHLYRDRAGSASPGSVPVTWATLRRVVALAGKEARGDSRAAIERRERKTACDWFELLLKQNGYKDQPIWDEFMDFKKGLLG